MYISEVSCNSQLKFKYSENGTIFLNVSTLLSDFKTRWNLYLKILPSHNILTLVAPRLYLYQQVHVKTKCDPTEKMQSTALSEIKFQIVHFDFSALFSGLFILVGINNVPSRDCLGETTQVLYSKWIYKRYQWTTKILL